MPPPPTMPMTEAERMSDSNRSRMYERKLGRICGTTPKRDDMQAPRPHRGDPFDLAGIDGLDGFAQELAEDAAGVDAEREHARKRPQPHSGDEHQGEHKLIDGAQQIHGRRAAW